MTTQSLTQEIEEVMKNQLKTFDMYPEDGELSIAEMLQASMAQDEDFRVGMMAGLIERIGATIPEGAAGEAEILDEGEVPIPLELIEWEEVDASIAMIDWATAIGRGYLEPPSLTPDEDVERLIARQKEMMDTVFGGIGEERKSEKRQGLAMQQLQLEQQQALRLILGFATLPDLVAHLKACLADPDYGYGERGSNGRTIAQGLQSVAEEEDVEFEAVVAAWWQSSEDFRRQVLAGMPFSMRPLFDETTLESFQPVLQRTGDTGWQLGSPEQGKSRVFEGELYELWGEIGDALVEWVEGENEDWLADLRQRAGRLPFHIARPAQADRLRKEVVTVVPKTERGDELEIHIARLKQDEAWPRFLTLGDRVGISRLNGHGFYEAAWEGGEKHRRFEISGTTKNRIPVEHTEIALAMGEILAGDDEDAKVEPTTPAEIEAAYLRRMKATGVKLGPAPTKSPLDNPGGSIPAATYTVTGKAGPEVEVVCMSGGEVVACALIAGEAVVALRRDERAGLLVAHPVRRGRVRLAQKPLTTSLDEIGRSAMWVRAQSAWAAWLAQCLGPAKH